MLNGEQSEIVVDIIRKTARMMMTDRPTRILHRINTLIDAQEALVPECFLLPLSSCLKKAIEKSTFDSSLLPVSVLSLFNKNCQFHEDNLAALQKLGVRVRKEFRTQPEDLVIGDDGAVLSGLYDDLGTYRVGHWAAFLQDGTCVNGDKPRQVMRFAEEWSERVQLGNSEWRKPKPALMIALLANDVGDPRTNPEPPVWHHLGLAVLLWKDKVKADQVLEISSQLSQKQNVERGLAIAAHILPETSHWLKFAKLDIPKWELKFAIPIAARKLVIGDRG
jgi:hypothetical protein